VPPGPTPTLMQEMARNWSAEGVEYLETIDEIRVRESRTRGIKDQGGYVE